MKMKTNKLWLPILAALLMAVFFNACKKDKYVALGGKCPVVESTNPINGEINVQRNKIITVTFNEKMDPATINLTSFSLLQGSIKVLGTLTYDGTGVTMSFAPTTTLAPNELFTGRLTTAAKDPLGNALQTDYIWSFQTGSTLDTIRPFVISTDPINTATNVVLNKIVSANFSEQMNPATISGSSFKINQGSTAIAGVITYTGTNAYFTPSSNLLPGSIYMATITTAAKDLAGNSMLANYTWSFTTSTSSTAVSPSVITTDPTNNQTGVALNKIITATFSTQMDPLTITTTNFKISQGTTPISGTVSYSGLVATFAPSALLAAGSIYNATITTGALDLIGNPINSNYVWTFSTVSTVTVPVLPFVDLKTVARFGIIAGVGVSNNAGFSVINNLDVGISPGVRSSVTGFPPATVVGGTIYASDDALPVGTAAMLIQAKADLTAAYLFAEAATSPAPITVAGDMGGSTLTPGIYKSTSTLLIQAGNLTLDAQGDPNAFWVFQIPSAFTTVGGAGGNVILSGGTQAKNVFWQVGSSATIGDFTSFKGNILALTSVTMNSGAVATGRMLCINGAVVLTSTNIINKP